MIGSHFTCSIGKAINTINIEATDIIKNNVQNIQNENTKKSSNPSSNLSPKSSPISGQRSPNAFLVLDIQRSIIRTNCVDCLDRPNVVQTTIGRWALIHQLRLMGVGIGGGGGEIAVDAMTLPDKVSISDIRVRVRVTPTLSLTLTLNLVF
jgi:hypothetical protein